MSSTISLIIPAYNEEKRIEKSLIAAIDYFEKESIQGEIIVVDDGSKDNTIDVVSSYKSIRLLKQIPNQGKGAAVRRGMLESNGDYRIFTDADFSTPIHEMKKLTMELDRGADICIGSRALDKNMIKEHQPFYREFMGKTFNKIVQLLLFKGIKDTQCGFKGFTKKSAELVFNKAKINGFSFDVEILFLARELNLNIAQVPIEWYNDDRSRVNAIKDSIAMFTELIKIRNMHK